MNFLQKMTDQVDEMGTATDSIETELARLEYIMNAIVEKQDGRLPLQGNLLPATQATAQGNLLPRNRERSTISIFSCCIRGIIRSEPGYGDCGEEPV